jgi:hyperosmotically inducible periplasmic protein
VRYLFATVAVAFASANLWAGPAYLAGTAQSRIERAVRDDSLILPYYGVFDELKYCVDGSAVTLLGYVTRPTLKDDAESAVKRIEAVEKVNNAIEPLPISPEDDGIRLTGYREAIYGGLALKRYALRAMPPIHIVVKSGKATLEGIVAHEIDKNLAETRANGYPGAFSVTNNLRIEK